MRVDGPTGKTAPPWRVAPLLLCLVLTPSRADDPPKAPGGDDGQWVMPSRTHDGTRFSGLDQITTKNVKDLKVAWTFSTGVDRGQEAAPIVVGSTMYVV